MGRSATGKEGKATCPQGHLFSQIPKWAAGA